MPLYQYQCEFGHTIEEYQSIKEFNKDRIVNCPECSNQMEQIISGGLGIHLHSEPTTIGQLGEKNWDKLGKVKQDEKIGQMRESRKKAQNEMAKEMGVDTSKIPDYSKMKKLANLNSEQKKRYIQTGKLPPGK